MAVDFTQAFEIDEPVPASLKAFSQAFCQHFYVSGICDPMYVVNVSAKELCMGDGCGTFWQSGQDATGEDVHDLAKRLMISYSTCIQQSEPGVTQADIEQMIVSLILGNKVPEAACH